MEGLLTTNINILSSTAPVVFTVRPRMHTHGLAMKFGLSVCLSVKRVHLW